MDTFNNNRIEAIAKKYAEFVMNEYHVSSMYLFGSYDKGNFTDDSELILLLSVTALLETQLKIL